VAFDWSRPCFEEIVPRGKDGTTQSVKLSIDIYMIEYGYIQRARDFYCMFTL